MKDPGKVAYLLYSEIEEFGELLDSHENIEAPADQLNAEGQLIQTTLKSMGIDTQEKLEILSNLLCKFKAL
jgi:hypothetical protein